MAKAGTYDLSLLTATTLNNASYAVTFTRDGATTAYADTGKIVAGNTGSWSSYGASTTTVALEAGVQTVRVTFSSAFGFRGFELLDTGTQISRAGTSTAVIIDLENDHLFNATRILPLGDSITYGVDVPGGYRAMLWDDLVTKSGYWFDFVGAYKGNPGTQLHDVDHQGFSGITSKSVAGQINTIASNSPADVALIMLGTNDTTSFNNAVDTVAGHLSTIMQRLDAINPGIEIFLSTLTVRTNPNLQSQIDQINAQLPGLVAQAESQGLNVTLVDMSALTLDDLADGVHPNANGYALMTAAWEAALLDTLETTGSTFNGTPTGIDGNITRAIGSEAGDRLLGDSGANELNGLGG